MQKAMLVVAAAVALAGCGRDTPLPDVTVQQLMANEVQPTTEIFWDSVQYISDEDGNHDIFPQTDEEWQRTRDAATEIGRLARLLQTPAYVEGRGEDWSQISASLEEVSKMAEQAAEDRDVEKVFEIGGTIYNVCSACHQIYPPAAGFDPTRPGGDGAEDPPRG